MPLDVGGEPALVVVALEVEGAPLVPASPDLAWAGHEEKGGEGKQRLGIWALRGTIPSFLLNHFCTPVQRPSFLLTVSPAGQNSALEHRSKTSHGLFKGFAR